MEKIQIAIQIMCETREGMSKYCQRCRFENPDDTFWCQNCNTKIINNVVQNTQHPIPHYLEQENKRQAYEIEQLKAELAKHVKSN